MMNLCACHSAKPFAKCCGRFLDANQYPKTPEQLMRSRFSAFKLGNHGEYLMKTWLPVMTQGLSAEELSQTSCEWLTLEIVKKSQQGDDGFVEFKASFKDFNNNDDIRVHHESSVFKRINGKWLYVGGEVQ